MYFIINNKHFKCSNIWCSLASQLARFLYKMGLFEGVALTTWFEIVSYCVAVLCCYPPILLAICIIMKIATYLFYNILKLYMLKPHLYQFMICSADFASQLTMSAEYNILQNNSVGCSCAKPHMDD